MKFQLLRFLSFFGFLQETYPSVGGYPVHQRKEKKWISILSLMIFLLLATYLPGQQYQFKTYSINDGLVHNNVRKIYQDKKGFLWIGTWEGLSKYDGHRFINYTITDGMSNDFINELVEMPDGSMTVLCNDGSAYSLASSASPKKISTNSIVVNTLLEVEKNKWLALTDYYGVRQWEKGRLQRENISSPVISFFKGAIFNDSLIALLSDDTLQLVDRSLREFAQSADGNTNYYDCSLLTDSKGRCWVGTNTGLRLLNPVQERGSAIAFIDLPEEFRHPMLVKMPIRAILEDRHQNLWFGTSTGLVRMSKAGELTVITTENGLQVPDILCLYMDKEENLWIGTGRGLSKLVTRTQIRQYIIDEKRTTTPVYQLKPITNGEVFALTDERALRFSSGNNRFSNMLPDKFSTVEDQHRFVTVIDKDIKQRFTLFSNRPGKPIPYSPGIGVGQYAFQDNLGFFFSPGPYGVRMSIDLINWKTVFFGGDVRALIVDTKGKLWAGTYNDGLMCISYRYQKDTPVVIRKEEFLPGIGIRSIFEDSKGNIWAGTRYHGVFKLQSNRNSQQFSREVGLSSNRILTIAEDKKGAIWLNFFNGLDKLVPEGHGYRVFNFSNALNFFPGIHGIVTAEDSTVWVATPQGVVQIKDGETEAMSPVETVITTAIFGDSVYNPIVVQNISLAHTINQVQFAFAAPGFINEKQILYSYRLLGSSNEAWSKPSNEYRVSYASLKYGHYIFEVRNLGYNNQWGHAVSVPFTIQPPFWLSWWFITAMAILAGASLYLFVRMRFRNIRSKSEMKHRVSEAEMQALRAQMNPHFIFNCLNAIDGMIQTNQKAQATLYLSRFARLIRSVLENSKDNLVSFQRDFETMKLYLELEQFRCNNKFRYQMTVDPELMNSDYKVPPLIVQPYVENAIHHGLMNKDDEDRELLVNISLKTGIIEYQIRDNGVGRILANELRIKNHPGHTSYGMQISSERIKMHNGEGVGEIQVEDLYDNGKATGTLVTVYIKIE